MSLKSIHPAVLVTAGFFLIMLIQQQSAVLLAVCVIPLMLLVAWCATAKWMQVVGRMRYIFFALFVLFAWQTPGLLVLPAIGSFSPSKEGLFLAFEQLLRLLGAASVVAALLHWLDAGAWMSGLHVLLQPLAKIGFSIDRFVLRLRLVLDYVADRDLNWRHVLDEVEKVDPVGELVWVSAPLAKVDQLLLAVLLFAFLGALWWQG